MCGCRRRGYVVKREILWNKTEETEYCFHACTSGEATPKHTHRKQIFMKKKKTLLYVHKRQKDGGPCGCTPKTSFICRCIKNVWLWFSYNVCHITKWQVFQLSNNDLFGNSIALRRRRRADVKWIKHWMEGSWQLHFNLSSLLSESLREDLCAVGVKSVLGRLPEFVCTLHFSVLFISH